MRIRPQREGRLYGALPSVTNVLQILDDKAWMNAWKNRVGHVEANRVTEEAQALGTKVHALARKIATGDAPLALGDAYLPDDMVPYAGAIRGFLDKYVGEVLGTEMEFVSDSLGFGGTADLYCQLRDGSYAVIDWKTTTGTERKMGLQLAAYALLLREAGHRVNKRGVVHIRKDEKRRGTFKVRWYEDHAGDVEAWRGCLAVWRWKNKGLLEKLQKEAG